MLSMFTISGLPSPLMSATAWRSSHSPGRVCTTCLVKLPAPSFSYQYSPTPVSVLTRSGEPLPVRSTAETPMVYS